MVSVDVYMFLCRDDVWGWVGGGAGGPMQQALDRVLKAYALYRPDIGYVQGGRSV